MSRLSQLPPRFPNPIRVQQQQPAPNLGPVRYLGGGGDDQLLPLHRFPSQDSFFDEQALWLDGLLDDSGGGTASSGSGTSRQAPAPAFAPAPPPLRRAVSDPVGMLQESAAFDFSSFCSSPLYSDDNDGPHGGGGCRDADDLMDKITACSGLDSGSLYGPNSPRRMKSLTESESSAVSAAFEGVNWGNPFQYVSVNPPPPAAHAAAASASDANNKADVKPDAAGAATSANLVVEQDRAVKRHTGQRSRVRKLQYIAELEKTVNLYQAMEADLAAKVASLFHQRAMLSIENSNLKQQLAGLKKDKMFKDGEHQFLKKELKKLKATAYGYQAHHRKSMSSSCYPMGMGRTAAVVDSTSEANWTSLDMAMGNLSLKETPLSMKYGFRS